MARVINQYSILACSEKIWIKLHLEREIDSEVTFYAFFSNELLDKMIIQCKSLHKQYYVIITTLHNNKNIEKVS